MKKLLFFLGIITFSMHAAEFTFDKYDAQDVLAISAIEATLKTVYLNAFQQIYKDYWTAEFEQSYVNFFYNYFEKLKHNNEMLLIAAKKSDHVVGWILFSCQYQSAIIDIICVAPEFQQQGIGKALIFSIESYAPKIKSLVVATRKTNAASPLFYEKLGFTKTILIHPDYNADEKQAYELNI